MFSHCAISSSSSSSSEESGDHSYLTGLSGDAFWGAYAPHSIHTHPTASFCTILCEWPGREQIASSRWYQTCLSFCFAGRCFAPPGGGQFSVPFFLKTHVPRNNPIPVFFPFDFGPHVKRE